MNLHTNLDLTLIWQEAAIKKQTQKKIIASWKMKKANLVRNGYKKLNPEKNYSFLKNEK